MVTNEVEKVKNHFFSHLMWQLNKLQVIKQYP